MRVIEGIDAAECERQCDQQATGSDERQHERHAGHQVLVGTGGPGFLGRAARSRGARLHAGLGQCLADQVLAVVDRRLGATLEQALASEARQIDFAVGGNQHQIGGRDFLVAQRVLRAHRALGFHPDRVSQRLGRLLQAFGRHERVGDAGRAGGDGDDVLAGACRGCGRQRCQRCKRIVQYFAEARAHDLGVAEAGAIRLAVTHTQQLCRGGSICGWQRAGHALIAADFDHQLEPALAGGAA